MTIQTYSLPELVDLALKTPIIGVVNFGILRTVLHILIKELGLQSFRTKLNIIDMKPQKIDVPLAPRRPSDIAKSVEREFLSEMEEMNEIEEEVPEFESINVFSLTGIDDAVKPIEYINSVEESNEEHDESQQSIRGFEKKSELFDEPIKESSVGIKVIETHSTLSDSSVKVPTVFQEDMAEFWKSTAVNSRITALEGGLEKIIDIIDEQARDLEHFRRDTERRRSKDNNKLKDLQINLEELCQTSNEVIKKIDSCIIKKEFQVTLEEHGKYVLEMNNQLQDVDERLVNLGNKLEGDYKMHEVLDDISDIKSVLKIPTRKQLANQFGGENIQNGEYPPDMQQMLGTTSEFEKLQIKMATVEEQLEQIADSNKEMLRIRAEEEIANKEKMAEKEAVIEHFSSYIEESKDKMIDFHELLKVLSNKLNNLTDTVAEISKIQDETMEEGRKNLQTVEEQLREIFKELKKLSRIEDIQFHLEEMKKYKADRSEMLSGFETKADKIQFDEKVDKTTFLVSCEEINSGLNDILDKIANQNQSLARTVQDLTVILNQKLERKEMDDYRENMKERLKIIVTKLKQLKDLVEEGPNAAGVKVRCISCDRPLKQNEKIVISDCNHNAVLSRHTDDQPFEGQKFLPPLINNKTSRPAGGFHTLKTSSLCLQKEPTAISQTTKVWEEVPLQGSDRRIYRGYLEKSKRFPV